MFYLSFQRKPNILSVINLVDPNPCNLTNKQSHSLMHASLPSYFFWQATHQPVACISLGMLMYGPSFFQSGLPCFRGVCSHRCQPTKICQKLSFKIFLGCKVSDLQQQLASRRKYSVIVIDSRFNITAFVKYYKYESKLHIWAENRQCKSSLW